ncbi:MAG: hypothetical protein D6798_16555 [Deltaproteobacteria bacterium]|nr:MAG: hypothetical protein D6798_16555 [Deltaproteobacteria bacterium]
MLVLSLLLSAAALAAPGDDLSLLGMTLSSSADERRAACADLGGTLALDEDTATLCTHLPGWGDGELFASVLTMELVVPASRAEGVRAIAADVLSEARRSQAPSVTDARCAGAVVPVESFFTGDACLAAGADLGAAWDPGMLDPVVVIGRDTARLVIAFQVDATEARLRVIRGGYTRDVPILAGSGAPAHPPPLRFDVRFSDVRLLGEGDADAWSLALTAAGEPLARCLTAAGHAPLPLPLAAPLHLVYDGDGHLASVTLDGIDDSKLRGCLWRELDRAGPAPGGSSVGVFATLELVGR